MGVDSPRVEVVETRGQDRSLVVLSVVAAFLVALTVFRLSWVLPNVEQVYGPSDVQIALARDFSEGVFYRPVLSDMGYGGTRYMPMLFVVHGLLIRLTGSVLWSGYAISLACGVGLIWGVGKLLTRLGCNRNLAYLAAIGLLSTRAMQHGIASIHADLPAAMFNIWGLVLCTYLNEKKWQPYLCIAAVVFTAAFLNKFTTLYGLAAGCLWLFIHGRRARAILLGAASGVLMLASIGLIWLASGGRWWEIFQACAAGGGMYWPGPIQALSLGLRNDFIGIPLTALALVGLLLAGKKWWMSLEGLTLVLTVIATMVIFTSPGAWINHFMDTDVIAWVVAVRLLSEYAPRIGRSAAVWAVTALMVFGCGYVVVKQSREGSQGRHMAVVKIIQQLAEKGEPMLIERPGLCSVAGVKPYVLDPFMLRVIRAGSEEVSRRFEQQIETQFFQAIVLCSDPVMNRGSWLGPWYENMHFGSGFAPRVIQFYERDMQYEDAIVYVPRKMENQLTAHEGAL